jgi:hypothetical protein
LAAEVQATGGTVTAAGEVVLAVAAMVVVGVMGAAAMAAAAMAAAAMAAALKAAAAARSEAAMVEAAMVEGGKAGVSVAVGRTGEKVDMVAPAGAMVG